MSGQNKEYIIIGGTTTVTLLTKDSIWMAADSRETSVENKKIVGARLHLKINVCNNIFFTVTGSWGTIRDDKKVVRFDAKKIIINTINKYKNFDSSFDNSRKTIAEELNALWKDMPDDLKEELKGNLNGKLVEVMMVCNDGGLFYKAFDIGLVLNNGVYEFVSIAKPLFVNKIYMTGFSKEIHKVIDSPDFAFDIERIKETLIELIELEVKANPDKVGGTVDVVNIYKNGYKWLTKNVY